MACAPVQVVPPELVDLVRSTERAEQAACAHPNP
jgi:hypothetical protein